MNIEKLKVDGRNIAVVTGLEKIIVDTQSALDLVMKVKYETGASYLVIDKKLIDEEFFILSTGIAGEILQKNGKLSNQNCHLRQFFALYQ